MSIFDDFDDIKDSEKEKMETPTPNNNWRTCGIIALVAFVLMCSTTSFGWSTFMRFGIRTDIVEYSEFVEKSSLDMDTRVALINRLEDTREHMRDGPRPSFFRWLEYDDEMTEALGDYEITAIDLATVDRILTQLESE